MNIDFCFFHIEKCMGTSLREMLFNYFKNIYNTNKIYGNNGGNLINLNDLNKIIQNKYNVFIGHCSFNKIGITDFSKSCFSITCVREPIERFLSHYYWFFKPTTNLNFNELNEEDIIYYINNCAPSLLTFRLSGETQILQDAIDNLNYINCILIQSEINTDIIHLNKILNSYTNTNNHIDLIELFKNNDKNNNKTNRLLLDLEKLKPFMNLFENDIYLYNYIKNMNIESRFKFINKTNL